MRCPASIPRHRQTLPRLGACRAVGLTIALTLYLAALAFAQEGAADLDRQSLALRTALHHDPTLSAPLTGLVNLYREASRTDELVALYRRHLEQWPQDAGARIVLVRILAAVNDPEAGSAARAAAQRFPDVPFVQFLLHQQLDASADPAALDALDRAIRLETSAARQRQWIELLLPKAAMQQRDDLIDAHLETLATLVADSPQGAADVAAIMIRHERYGPALAALDAALQRQPAPEVMVQLELTAADAEVGLDRGADAGKRLDALLGKVAHDYWRRDEILRRRVALVTDAAERQRLIDTARERWSARPDHVAAVLELARLLEGFEQRREALDVLIAAGQRQPHSQPIETFTLDLFDALRDERGRVAYLEARLQQQPERDDLTDKLARSLFLLGRRDEAVLILQPRLAPLSEAARLNRLLEMARFLRRSALTADAALLFAQAAELAPARLDIRRELAEVYLALDRQREAQALFVKPVPPDAAIENLLDLVGFLIDKEMYVQARVALRDRLPREPVNIELRMLLLKVEAELGARQAALETIDEARRLADTTARYRSWLEGAMQCHDAFDTTEAFLEGELDRIKQETADLSLDGIERRMAFAEVTTRTKHAGDVNAMLEEALAGELPPELRIKLRRHVIGAMSDAASPDVTRLEAQLKALAADDPMARHEADARMAVLLAKQNRGHEVGPLLASLDPAAISDPKLLSQLIDLLSNYGHHARLGSLLERITQVDPTNRGAWERWLATLAVRGEEERLRVSIRRLLAGVDRMPLSDETKASLGRALMDSYWRSIARLLAAEGEASHADALALLDAAQRIASSDVQAMWITWCRAYVLHRQDRAAQRDEALDELARLASQDRPADASAARVIFPSGMSIAVETARRLLTSPPAPHHVEAPSDPRGPMPLDGRLNVRWCFDTPGRAAIIAVMPTSDAILLADVRGTIWCIEQATGKLRWQRESAIAATATMPVQVTLSNFHGRYGAMVSPVPAKPMLDGQRLYVAEDSTVVCLSVDDGRVLWRSLAPAAASSLQLPGQSRTSLAIFPRGDRVLAYDATCHGLFTFDAATGKLVEERLIAADAAAGAVPLSINSGAWLYGSRVLVYGTAASVYDLELDQEMWSFDPNHASRLPVKLEAPGDDGAPAPAMTMGPPTSLPQQIFVTRSSSGAVFGRSGWSGVPSGVEHVNFLASAQGSRAHSAAPGTSMVLTTPATMWADLSVNATQPRMGLIAHNRLVLLNISGATILPMDLPLAGTTASVAGVFVGLRQSRACFMSPTALQVLDVRSGQVQTCPLDDVRGNVPHMHARLGAAIDGAIVHVTGPGGIVGINIATARRVYKAHWPEPFASELVSPATAAGNTQPPAYAYQLHGIAAMTAERSGQYGPIIPLIDGVTDTGLLLTSPAPGQLVALTLP